MKIIACLVAIICAVVFAMPCFAINENFIGDYPTIEQLQIVVDCIKAGQKEVQALKSVGKISAKEAEEMNKVIDDLINDQYKVGDCGNPAAYGCVRTLLKPVGVPINLSRTNFFGLTEVVENTEAQTINYQTRIVELSKEIRHLPPGKERDEKQKIMEGFQNAVINGPSAEDRQKMRYQAQLAQFSVLIHEWKHKQYVGMTYSSPDDKEAFALQLKWLKLFGEDPNSILSITVNQHLAKAGTSPVPQPTEPITPKGNPEFEKCVTAPLKTYNDYVDWSKKVRDKDYWSLFRCGPVGANWQEYPDKTCCDTYVPKEDWNGLQDCGWKFKLEKEKATLDNRITECKKQYPGQ